MKKRFSRALCALLALFLLLPCLPLVGCGKGGERNTLAHALMDEGYAIVAALGASQAVEDAVSKIERVFVQTDAKTRPPVRNDYIQYGNAIPRGEKEIIVGVTTRPTSQEAYTALCSARVNNEKDWQIKIGEGEVLLIGGSDEAVVQAADAFCAMLTEPKEKYPLSGYDSGIVQHTWSLTQLANRPISSYSIVIPEGADARTQTAALTLQAAIYTASGYRLPILDDTQTPRETALVLGYTSYGVSAQAHAALEASRPNYAHDSILFEQNGQLAILGGHTDALCALVDTVIEDYLTDAEQAELAAVNLPMRDRDLQTVTIGATDLGYHRIVYAKNADLDTQLLAVELRNYLYTEYGYYLDLVTDETSVDPKRKEILVGKTNRAASQTLSLSQYAVRIDDKDNLYFDAGHYVGLMQSYDRLLVALDAQGNAKTLTVPTYTGAVERIPLTYEFDPDRTFTLGATTYKNSEILAGFDFDDLYTLVWNDEFTGDTLQAEKWSLSVNANMPATSFSDAESELRVSDGMLQLYANLASRTAHTFKTSYSVATHDTMNFSGGYLETRARMPFGDRGVYASFWGNSHNAVLYKQAYRDSHEGALYDAGYAVEVDFGEVFASSNTLIPNIQKFFTEQTREQYAGVSSGVDLSGFKTGYAQSATTPFVHSEQETEQFHTYGFLWTDDLMAFAVDGQFYYCYSFADLKDSFAPTYRDKLTREPRQFGSDGLQRENMALSVIFNHLVIGEEYAQYFYWARDKALRPQDYDDFFPLAYTVDYVRLYQCEEDFLYTPETVGQGTRFYDATRYRYAINGAAEVATE